LGRIAKTFYLLHYVADETYRRRIQIQLNRGNRATVSRERSSMAVEVNCAKPIAKARKSSSGRLGLS
jgi:hypothetical protein